MIAARNIGKSFGTRRVLRGLTLTAHPSAVTLLVGANGAGKTTALRIMAGLADPDVGTVEVAGFDLHRDRRSALGRLSFLPQAPHFHPGLTGAQVAAFHARLRGRIPAAVDEALGRWGLLDSSRVATGKLSGGMRQRLALAIVQLADAPVLLLDEPGLSLDPEWREELRNFLEQEAKRGRTILVATHLLGEWEGRADRCLLVVDGRSSGEIDPTQLRDAFPGRGTVGSERRSPCATGFEFSR